MERFSHGLQVNGVKLAVVAEDGGAGTVYTSPGKVLEDTIQVTTADPTETEFTAQGDTEPSVIAVKKGITEGSYDVMTFDPEVIADLTGGSTSGAGENMVYNAPIGAVPDIFRSQKITDSQGIDWLWPRVKLTATLDGQFRTGTLNLVKVKFKVLQPTKAGVAPFTYGKPAA